jgi:hypothetical protein
VFKVQPSMRSKCFSGEDFIFTHVKFQQKMAYSWANNMVKTGFLEARLRPVEQLDREVEIGRQLSWTYD